MVLPMPAIHITPIPTDYALKCRNWFWAFATLILICAGVKIFVFLDIIPGFMMFVISATGYYVTRDRSVDMNCLMSWGMICLINGIFDCVFLIDKAVKMPQPVFSVHQNFVYNLVHFILICGPVGEILVSFMVYRVYKDATCIDHTNIEPQQQPILPGTSYGSTTNGQGSIRQASPTSNGTEQVLPPSQTTRFEPFAGKGNTLGAE